LGRQLAQALSELSTQTSRTEALSLQERKLQEALSTASTDLSAARQSHEQQNAALQQHGVLQQRLAEERRLLLQRLHEAHGELARLHQQVRTLDERLPFVGRARAQGMDLGRAEVTAVRDEPPHREVSLELRDVRLPGRAPTSLSARLVEHLGHPGLVLFADGEPVITAWQESAQEGTRPLMLLVPSDLASRQRLAAFTASDWHLLQALLSAVDQSVRTAGPQLPPRWSQVLRRLRAELAALPPTLRHDRLHCEPVQGEGGAEGLAIRLENVDLDGRLAERWGLRWWPTPEGGELVKRDALEGRGGFAVKQGHPRRGACNREDDVELRGRSEHNPFERSDG
jgi:hypothetical protein